MGGIEEKHKRTGEPALRPEFILRNMSLPNNLIIDLHNVIATAFYWAVSVRL
jgi:hypothetical protein